MKKNNKNAQSAIEFVILVGFLLFFFVLFIFSINSNISGKVVEQQNILAREIALGVQKEIEYASESGDGYSREFKIPEKIGNSEYNITLADGLVYIKTDDGKYATSFPILDVEGEIRKGANHIKKENGRVKLNE